MLPVNQRELFKNELLEKQTKELDILDKFKTCYNKRLDLEFTHNIKDKWDGRQTIYNYEMKLKNKNGA